MRSPIPGAVLIYGLLGLVPFLGPPAAGLLLPALRPWAAVLLVFYGALILSFLGGARWGLAIARSAPSVITISLAMLPTLVALALLWLPSNARRWQLFGLAAALALHWLWDMGGSDLPPWYSRLRTILTVGAVAGLGAGGLVLS
jgi:hypothetical protein